MKREVNSTHLQQLRVRSQRLLVVYVAAAATVHCFCGGSIVISAPNHCCWSHSVMNSRLCHYISVWLFIPVLFVSRSRGSLVSIVSGYGVDDRVIEVRSPAGAKNFSSSLCVQTGSGAHPASCPVGTGGPFPGGKARQGRDSDRLLPSSAEVVNE
jgi:hypothetical protein